VSAALAAVGTSLGFAMLACYAGALACQLRGRRQLGRWLTDLADWPLIGMEACYATSSALQGQWGAAVFFAAIAALAAWSRWRKRRKRDRAPRMYGYKARAALTALVRKARETAQPRPVLRPAPQGGW